MPKLHLTCYPPLFFRGHHGGGDGLGGGSGRWREPPTSGGGGGCTTRRRIAFQQVPGQLAGAEGTGDRCGGKDYAPVCPGGLRDGAYQP